MSFTIGLSRSRCSILPTLADSCSTTHPSPMGSQLHSTVRKSYFGLNDLVQMIHAPDSRFPINVPSLCSVFGPDTACGRATRPWGCYRINSHRGARGEPFADHSQLVTCQYSLSHMLLRNFRSSNLTCVIFAAGLCRRLPRRCNDHAASVSQVQEHLKELPTCDRTVVVKNVDGKPNSKWICLPISPEVLQWHTISHGHLLG
jgi:hypothetical protein